jgi:RNA polymerase sigma-70 factor (sigma-E family)
VNDSDRAEFTDFVAGRTGALIRVAYALTADQHAAEDLLQSALMKAAGHWRRIHTSPEAYVRQIMYREQVRGWRRLSRHREIATAAPPDRQAVPDAGAEARLDLHQALRALPAGRRAVVILRYLEDLPEAQVADLLGCSVGTVRSQAHRGITQLRTALAALDLTSNRGES